MEITAIICLMCTIVGCLVGYFGFRRNQNISVPIGVWGFEYFGRISGASVSANNQDIVFMISTNSSSATYDDMTYNMSTSNSQINLSTTVNRSKTFVFPTKTTLYAHIMANTSGMSLISLRNDTLPLKLRVTSKYL